jgi:hypothetical protein
MEQSEKWDMRIWVWWAGLTALYLAMLVFSAALFSDGSFLSSAWNTITFFIGMFVPFGFLNTLTSFAYDTAPVGTILPIGFLTVPLLAAVVFWGDKIARKMGMVTYAKKIAFNLIVLLTLTFIVDFSIYQKWPSLGLFLQAVGVERSVIPDFLVYKWWFSTTSR